MRASSFQFSCGGIIFMDNQSFFFSLEITRKCYVISDNRSGVSEDHTLFSTGQNQTPLGFPAHILFDDWIISHAPLTISFFEDPKQLSLHVPDILNASQVQQFMYMCINRTHQFWKVQVYYLPLLQLTIELAHTLLHTSRLVPEFARFVFVFQLDHLDESNFVNFGRMNLPQLHFVEKLRDVLIYYKNQQFS